MAYDAATGNMVLFGGGNNDYLNDTWTYSTPPPGYWLVGSDGWDL